MTTIIKPTEIVRLYRIWTSIFYRCTRPENKQYKNYGERGISLCKEWTDFDRFCEDVAQGSKVGLHLDRIDNNKGYFKENCRWTSPKINHRNKRNNAYYETHVGKICQAELIELTGYTRRQFQRSIEKHGVNRFLKMFKEGTLPKKRPIPDLVDIIGRRFGALIILDLDEDKSTGARYFCECDCGKRTRISRFKILHGIATHCRSCSKLGDKNPNSTARREKKYCT